jgi:N-glycosylase/DNA lyase
MAMRIIQEVCETFVPQKILENYEMLSKDMTKKDWRLIPEEEIWHELCFCILSANVRYELASSALRHLIKKNLLAVEWIKKEKRSNNIIKNELSEPHFLPLKTNGELRKYRYPRKRATQIVKAAKTIYSGKRTIKKILHESKSDIETRQFFVRKIAGLGIKEASHFLRNIGYSHSLAIIDVHILSFLQRLRLVRFDKKHTVTNKIYLTLERIMRHFAKFHNLVLSVLDLAIWHYMRNGIK